MTQTEILLKEFKAEAEKTRNMLEKVPDDKFDWTPHPKSGTIKWLSTHLADIARWPDFMLATKELDFQNMPYQVDAINNREELLRYFEKARQLGQSGLEEAKEEDLEKEWTLRNGDYIIQQDPVRDFIRMAISQTIHHRAQLGVYLRLLDIPIPGSYGPSADEM